MPARCRGAVLMLIACGCALASADAVAAQAGAHRGAPRSPSCPALPVPSDAPAAGTGPAAYDIRLDPDFATGVLREWVRVAVRNPAHADSVELALNDWFDTVTVTAAGARATALHHPGSVVVRLAPARPLETLCFELAGRPYQSGDERRSVIGRESLFLLWSDAFYPLDYYAWAPVRLTIALPRGFRVFGPGHEIGGEGAARSPQAAGTFEATGVAGDDVVVHTFVSEHPLRLFSVLADRRWIETRRIVRGLPMRTLLYPGSQLYADSLLRRSADVLSVYAELFGPYAFDEFTFATLDSIYARRALTGGVVYSPAFLERELARTGFDGHETALLWWFYTLAGRGPGSFQWTEGLGDYAEYLYDERRGKPLPANWARFRAGYLALPADSEPPLARLSGRTPQAIVHGKYPWLLHLLRFELGDAAFRGALRALFADYRFRAFTLDEMVRSLEASTGTSLAWWQDWLVRPAVPTVHFTTTVEPAGERWRIVARLEQATPPFTFPVEIGVFTGAARDLRRVRVDSAAQTFVLTSAARPDSVVLDPRGWVLMRRR